MVYHSNKKQIYLCKNVLQLKLNINIKQAFCKNIKYLLLLLQKSLIRNHSKLFKNVCKIKNETKNISILKSNRHHNQIYKQTKKNLKLKSN